MTVGTLALPAATISAQLSRVMPTNGASISLVRWISGSVFDRVQRASGRAARAVEGLSDEALSYRLDKLASDPAIMDGMVACVEIASYRPIQWWARFLQWRRSGPTQPDSWKSLPEPAALAMAEGMMYARHVAEVVGRLRAVDGGATRENTLSAEDLQRKVYDPDMPPTIGQLVLASLRVGPALLALMALPKQAHSTTAVLLAHAFRDGQRAALVLLAALPGTQVSETILPLGERIDPAKLMADMRSRWEEIENLPIEGDPGEQQGLFLSQRPLAPGDVVRAYAGGKENRPCVVLRVDDSGGVVVAIAGQGTQFQPGDPCPNPAWEAEMGLDKTTLKKHVGFR
jgi:hypothetical protein